MGHEMADEKPDLEAVQQIKVWEVVTRAWRLYRENFLLFIGIALIGQVLPVLSIALMDSGVTGVRGAGQALGLAGGLVSLWVTAALIIATYTRDIGEQITFRECLARVKGRYLNYLMALVLCSLVFYVGVLLLVIPGIYFGIVLGLAPYVAVLEGRPGIGPLKRSAGLVRGSFWRVFVVGLILCVLSLVSFLLGLGLRKVSATFSLFLSPIISTLISPFSVAILSVLYHRLKEKEAQTAIGPAAEQPAEEEGGCCLGCALAVGLAVAVAVLIYVWVILLGGTPVAELYRKLTSSDISLPAGVQLERPEGWSAGAVRHHTEAYRLYKGGNEYLSRVMVWSVPEAELRADDEAIRLDDPGLAEEIQRKSVEKFRWLGKEDGYEPEPLEAKTLGNREWVQYTLRREGKPGEYRGKRVRRHTYTTSDGHVVIFTYDCGLREYEREEDNVRLSAELKQVEDIIASLPFPR